MPLAIGGRATSVTLAGTNISVVGCELGECECSVLYMMLSTICWSVPSGMGRADMSDGYVWCAAIWIFYHTVSFLGQKFRNKLLRYYLQ